VSIKARIRRLEGKDAGCPECYREPEPVRVFYPEEREPAPDRERCPGCGRARGVVIMVVYEGEGVIPIG
jgi:hypothetical protein